MNRETVLKDLKQGSIVVFDVRPRREYDAGHLEGAVSISLEELPCRVDEIPKKKQVVLYCRGLYCLLADEVQQWLSAQGIHAFRLDEGPLEWKAAGLPMQISAEPANHPRSGAL